MPQKIHRVKFVAVFVAAACLLATKVYASELSEVNAISPPAFSLPDIAGRTHALDEYAGKVVLVNFWASWCIPCIEEMPSIQRLMLAMANMPFTVVGVNVGEAQRRVQAMSVRLDIKFPVLMDKDTTVFKSWGATIMPATYILDRSGRVRYIGRGPIEWDRPDIVDIMKALASS